MHARVGALGTEGPPVGAGAARAARAGRAGGGRPSHRARIPESRLPRLPAVVRGAGPPAFLWSRTNLGAK